MARTVIITDDVTGESGAKPRVISIDKVEYELDLTDASFAELKKALRPFLKNARVTKGKAPATRRTVAAKPKRRPGRPAKKAAGSPSQAARAWAIEQGIAVPKRGRVPASVIAAYDAAKK